MAETLFARVIIANLASGCGTGFAGKMLAYKDENHSKTRAHSGAKARGDIPVARSDHQEDLPLLSPHQVIRLHRVAGPVGDTLTSIDGQLGRGERSPVTRNRQDERQENNDDNEQPPETLAGPVAPEWSLGSWCLGQCGPRQRSLASVGSGITLPPVLATPVNSERALDISFVQTVGNRAEVCLRRSECGEVFAVGLERCTRRSRVDGTNRLLHPNRASTRSIPNWVF